MITEAISSKTGSQLFAKQDHKRKSSEWSSLVEQEEQDMMDKIEAKIKKSVDLAIQNAMPKIICLNAVLHEKIRTIVKKFSIKLTNETLSQINGNLRLVESHNIPETYLELELLEKS